MNERSDNGGGASYTTDTARGSSEGTDVSLKEYIETFRIADHRLEDARINHLEDIIKSLEEKVYQRFDLDGKALVAALVAAEKAVDKALTTSKEAVDKAEVAANKRFDSTNEFRGQLADQAATFQRQDVANAQLEGLQRDINNNTRLIAEIINTKNGTDLNDKSHKAETNLRIAIAGLLLTFMIGFSSILVVFLTR